MKALVTGGFGFIGSHLADYLKRKGYWVRVADIKPRARCYFPLTLDEYFSGDLRRFDFCLEMTEDVDYVYNLAANMGGIGFISRVGADVMRDNALININVLEACRQNDVKRVFFSSSACVYPVYLQKEVAVKPLKEEYAIPANPDNFYGWEKIFTEKLMEAYERDYGLQFRIARFHNIYGPYGTFEGGREKAPASLCRKVAMAKDGDSIVVWGDGKQTRSFLYIDDCIRAVDLLMESDYSKPLNIGSDRLVSIDDLARMIIEMSGKDLTIEHDLTKPQGVRGRNADLTLIREVLGWEPRVNLESGLERTYKWIETNINQKNSLS